VRAFLLTFPKSKTLEKLMDKPIKIPEEIEYPEE